MAVVVKLADGTQESWDDGATYAITADHRLTVYKGDWVLLVCSPTGWLSVSGEARKVGRGGAPALPVSAATGSRESDRIGGF